MRITTLGRCSTSCAALVAGAVLWTLCLVNAGNAQSFAGAQGKRTYGTGSVAGTIDSGSTITIRTTEPIDVSEGNGRIFSGVVDQDVVNRRGNLAVPRGSNVELIVRETSYNEIALDVDSLTVNGERFGIQSGGTEVGTLIGATAANRRVSGQLLTGGGRVRIPAGSLLTFRLDQSLRAGVADQGYTRNGLHYHPGYSADISGGRQKPGYSNDQQGYYGLTGSIRIGQDNNITWNGPADARVYVSADNEPLKLFAAGQSGTQLANWIEPGHQFVFVLMDGNGNEIARDQVDLRNPRRFRR